MCYRGTLGVIMGLWGKGPVATEGGGDRDVWVDRGDGGVGVDGESWSPLPLWW